MAGENELIIVINGSAKNFLDELDKTKKKTKDVEKVLSETAKASAAAFAGFAASIAGVTKAFADYETALVGVGKTTNITGGLLTKFGKQFQKLSEEIPVSTNELLGIAQAAGQLGVEGEQNLLKFTETVAKLGVATDLSGEEAATSLTRILNVTKESIDTIDVFGSVIVRLGNNFAATESEIVRSTTEVSKATAVFNVSSAQAAALGTALKSLGQQAQLGGSVVGKSFLAIQKAINSGGESLKNLSQLTGIASEDLKKTFEEDATSVFQSFIEGLGNLEGGTSEVFKALEAFGLQGDEVNKVLPVLAKNNELVADALSQAAEETKNATALNEEAAKAFETLSSEFTRTTNGLTNLAVNIGSKLAPQIKELLKSTQEIVQRLNDLDESTASTIASFLKWGAIISGTVAGITAFLLGAIKLSAIITAIGAAFLPATVAASAFWVAITGPVGLAVAGIAALTAGFVVLKKTLAGTDADKSLANVDRELKQIKKTREEIAGISDPIGERAGQLKQLDEEIKKLEELREAKIRASEDFGTGQLLIQPEQGAFDLNIPGIDDDVAGPEIPLAPEGEDKSTEALKKSTEEKKAIVDAATQQRIETAKKTNEELLALQKERDEGATEAEIEAFQRRQEIQAEFAEAEKIKNAEERTLAIENLNLKHQQELAAIEQFEAQKDVRAEERQMARAELQNELDELDQANKDALSEKDKARLQDQLDTDSEARIKAANFEAARKVKERNQFKQDEIKFGTEVANVKAFFRRDEVQGFKTASTELAQLSQSRNSTLKGIGKQAARVNAAIRTAEGAISAYSALAAVPLIGPALGAAAAAAVIAFGVEQQAKISAAQTGGFVPPTSGGARDRVPTLLEPGELVVPQAIAPNFIQAAGIPDTQSEQAVGDVTESGTPVIEIMLEDRAGEVISLEQREGRSLGLIGE